MTRAGLLLLGLAVGLAGTALHQSFLWLAVTALAAAAITAATPPAHRLWWAAGFSLPPLAMSLPRGEGDVVLAGTGSNCTNEAECEAACPKGINISNIARMNREYTKALLLNRG